jgi:uncharacterized protein YjdB
MNNQVKKEVKKNKRRIAAWWWSIGAVLTLATLVTCSIALPATNSSSDSATSSSIANIVNQQISLVNVSVNRLPSNLTYNPLQVVSTSGGELRLVFSDDSSRVVAMSDSMIDSARLKLSTSGSTNVFLNYTYENKVYSTSYQINIVGYKVALNNLSVDIPSSSIVVGQSLALNLKLEPVNADLVFVTWVSSNNNIISVNTDGIITAKSVGQAVITVTANGMVANANFNVVEDLQAVKASQFRSVSQENSYIQQGYIPIQTISELNMIREDTLTFTASYNNVTYTFEEYDEVETNNLNALKRN